jgi:farnesyl-diphosphate farnesyltransferase
VTLEAVQFADVEAWSGKDRGDENFPVGSALISARVRPHVHAFYAFARNADDIADSPVLSADDKVRRLDVMEAVLIHGGSGSPSAARLREDLAETGVTPRHSLDLLIAFRRDATKLRYESWDELVDYCRCSAMPVGRHVLDLHGEGRQGWDASDALCTALQVLNHLQDCARDLKELDRCYLPRELLAAHRASVEDLRRPAASPGIRGVLDALLDQCDELNHTARFLPRRTLDRRLRLETAVIVGLSRRLAKRLRAGDPLATRVKLRKSDAVASILSALRFLP